MYGRIDGGMKRRMDRWKDEGLKDVDGEMDVWMEGRKEGWKDGRKD